MRRGGLAIASAAVVLALCAAPASAATIKVNTTKDERTSGDGRCSLREAVADVNSPGAAGPDCPSAGFGTNTIVLPAGIYSLGGLTPNPGALSIAASVSKLTITGPAPGRAAIDAAHLGDRVFTIASGPSVTISGLTIRNGHAPDGAAAGAAQPGNTGSNGGGILNQGRLTLRNVVLSRNRAGNGGSAGASSPAPGSAGQDGGSGGSGGAIFNVGTLTMIHVEVIRNSAGAGAAGGGGVANGMGNGGPAGNGGFGGFGGGVCNCGGQLTVIGGSFTGNAAGSGGAGGVGGGSVDNGGAAGAGGGGGWGGAIFGTGPMDLAAVTISGNTAGRGGAGGTGGSGGSGSGGAGGPGGAGGAGGGMYGQGDVVSVGRTTLSANRAGAGGDGGAGGGSGSAGGDGGAGGNGGDGGGWREAGYSLRLTNSTLASNSTGAGGNGGSGGQGGGFTGGNGGDGGSSGSGGGVAALVTTTGRIDQTTLAGNAVGSPGNGGALGTGQGGNMNGNPGSPGPGGTGGGVADGGSGLSISNTLLANNVSGNCSGSPADGGHNLSFDGTGCPLTFSSGNPKLRTLGNNGGPTRTIAIGSGSAALNRVPRKRCLPSDQRGVSRRRGARCDIGAYEAEPPLVTVKSPTALRRTTATLHGDVIPDAGRATVRFEFGTTKAYGSRTAAQTVSGVEPVAVVTTLRKLKPGIRYHYALVATSMDGTTTSADHTFRTPG